jgi:hypothetical protein
MALLIKLTAVQTMQTDTLYSVFHYEPTGANVPVIGSNFAVLNDNLISAATALRNIYDTTDFRDKLTTQWTLNRVEASYVGTTQAERDALPGNFAVNTGNAVSGTNVTEYLPKYVVASVRYSRPDASVRHGYKRLSGITEASNLDGSLVAGTRTSIITWATASLTLAKVVAHPSAADSCRYVCLRREVNGQELPTWRYLPCASVFVRVNFTTQDSRRYF